MSADDVDYELYIDHSADDWRWQALFRNTKAEPLDDMQVIDLGDAVILDTETTGLGESDQVIEIGIIDAMTGETLFHSIVKPVACQVSEEAQAIHGITEAMLVGAPSWLEIHEQIMSILSGRKVIGYNVDFDLGMLGRSHAMAVHCGDGFKGNPFERCDAMHEALQAIRNASEDVMYWYAEFAGDWHEYFRSYTWQKLSNAYYQECGKALKDAHRALGDCAATREVVQAVNTKIPAYNLKQAQRREARRLRNEKIREQWRVIKERQDVERAKMEARKQRAAERKAARLAALEANTLTRSDKYLMHSERPSGYMTASEILKKKLENECWHQVGICATPYGDRFKIYLPKFENDQRK